MAPLATQVGDRAEAPTAEGRCGGWRDPNTLLKCYQQPDNETLVNVVLSAPKLLDGGMDRTGKLPTLLPTSSRLQVAAGA